jgi:universal stress protein E
MAVNHIERTLASTPMAGAAKLHVGLTSPTHAILESAEHLKPELVVMETASRGGIAGLLMGNTAERLVDRSNCALLAVKPEDFVCPVSLREEAPPEADRERSDGSA